MVDGGGLYGQPWLFGHDLGFKTRRSGNIVHALVSYGYNLLSFPNAFGLAWHGLLSILLQTGHSFYFGSSGVLACLYSIWNSRWKNVVCSHKRFYILCIFPPVQSDVSEERTSMDVVFRSHTCSQFVGRSCFYRIVTIGGHSRAITAGSFLLHKYIISQFNFWYNCSDFVSICSDP